MIKGSQKTSYPAQNLSLLDFYNILIYDVKTVTICLIDNINLNLHKKLYYKQRFYFTYVKVEFSWL